MQKTGRLRKPSTTGFYHKEGLDRAIPSKSVGINEYGETPTPVNRAGARSDTWPVRGPLKFFRIIYNTLGDAGF